jgi:hypothetical protein
MNLKTTISSDQEQKVHQLVREGYAKIAKDSSTGCCERTIVVKDKHKT